MIRRLFRSDRLRDPFCDAPPKTLYGYVWRVSHRHQGSLVVMAVGVAVLDIVPLELQKRLIDDAIGGADMRLLVILIALYAATVLAEGVLKFLFRLYQAWLSESATRRSRGALLDRRTDGDTGHAVSVIANEVETLGGFVGDGISEPAIQIGTVIAAMAYMAFVEPSIALVSVAFLIPQIALAPLIQRRINRLTASRVDLMRTFSEGVSDGRESDRFNTLLQRILSNRMRLALWKFIGKFALNLLNHLAPISVLGYGGYMAIQGETSVGVIVAFMAGFERISKPIRSLISFYRVAAQTRVKYDKITEWVAKNDG